MFAFIKVYSFFTQLINVSWKSPVFSDVKITDLYHQYFVTKEIFGYSTWHKSLMIGDLPTTKIIGRYKTKEEAIDSITKLSSTCLKFKRLMSILSKDWIVINNFVEETNIIYFKEKLIHIYSGGCELYSLAHELGHYLAYTRGLDEYNEFLAWELGEELWVQLFNEAPPRKFYLRKEEGLRGHGLIN